MASLYLPSGEVGTERQEEKVRFMDAFLAHLKELRERAAADGREVLVCGDWNIAHEVADLKNWRGNTKNSGFLPEERAWLTRVLTPEEGGYVDVVRALHPGLEGPYTWWSYRGGLSTMTVDGALISTSPRPVWRGRRSRGTWSAPPRTRSAGRTTRR